MQRNGTVINRISSKQKKQLHQAVKRVAATIVEKFPGIVIDWEQKLRLVDIIEALRFNFPHVTFAKPLTTSSIKPDGGFLYLRNNNGDRFPILITEKKNQGTNDIQELEGKKKQSRGNAIERLGKNVIGLRTFLLSENIFPFVCFGDGCDFEEGSSICDRVITISMFGELNKQHLHNIPPFNRGAFYFRSEQWMEDEMFRLSLDIAISSTYYYFSRYGRSSFILE